MDYRNNTSIIDEKTKGFEDKQECMIVPIHEKLLLSVREAAAYSGVGINKIQSLLRMPRCPFVLFVGRKKLIKRKAFEKYIEENIFI